MNSLIAPSLSLGVALIFMALFGYLALSLRGKKYDGKFIIQGAVSVCGFLFFSGLFLSLFLEVFVHQFYLNLIQLMGYDSASLIMLILYCGSVATILFICGRFLLRLSQRLSAD